MRDLVSETIFKYRFRIGRTTETGVFDGVTENGEQEPDIRQDTIKLNRIEKHINRKALDKIDFYRFSNLRRFFPSLKSVDEFLTSENYLGEVDIEISGSKERINSLNNHDKYEVAINTFKELAVKIEASTTDYIGTKEFKGHNIGKVVDRTKTSEVLLGGEDQQYGIAMSDPLTPDELRLDLKRHDWYMYDENYGTSEEKYFVQFVRHAMDELKKKYRDIYLLRNERTFKIYRFSDGKAVEPDFVLFLTEKDTKKALSFQLFVEPKGQHLLKTDQWKEDFLKEIESHFEIVDLFETDKYKLVGLPFYNEALKKQEFKEAFERIVGLKESKKEKSDLFFSDVVPDEKKFVDYLPVYTLEAACGKFGHGMDVECKCWVPVSRKGLDETFFVARAVGHSMEPKIKNGDYCIFKANPGGPYSGSGRAFLFQYREPPDPETGGAYTIKGYRSHKGLDGHNVRIDLIPLNKVYPILTFEENDSAQLSFIAEFIEVIK